MSDLVFSSWNRLANLLLVEDNEADIFLTQEAFRNAGITNHLSIALDGEEALSMLRREGRYGDQPQPDLVLLDLNLPCLDGREVLMKMRADPNLKTIPVVVMSHSPSDIDFLKRGNLQADGYTTKPVDLDRLREIIATIGCFGLAVVMRHTRPACGGP